MEKSQRRPAGQPPTVSPPTDQLRNTTRSCLHRRPIVSPRNHNEHTHCFLTDKSQEPVSSSSFFLLRMSAGFHLWWKMCIRRDARYSPVRGCFTWLSGRKKFSLHDVHNTHCHTTYTHALYTHSPPSPPPLPQPMLHTCHTTPYTLHTHTLASHLKILFVSVINQ